MASNELKALARALATDPAVSAETRAAAGALWDQIEADAVHWGAEPSPDWRKSSARSD